MSIEDKKQAVELHALDQDAATASASSLSDTKPSGPRSFWSKLHDKISLQDDSNLTLSEMFLVNKDLQPVFDPNDRPWRWWNYIFFWIGGAFNLNTFQIARHRCITWFVLV